MKLSTIAGITTLFLAARTSYGGALRGVMEETQYSISANLRPENNKEVGATAVASAADKLAEKPTAGVTETVLDAGVASAPQSSAGEPTVTDTQNFPAAGLAPTTDRSARSRVRCRDLRDIHTCDDFSQHGCEWDYYDDRCENNLHPEHPCHLMTKFECPKYQEFCKWDSRKDYCEPSYHDDW